MDTKLCFPNHPPSRAQSVQDHVNHLPGAPKLHLRSYSTRLIHHTNTCVSLIVLPVAKPAGQYMMHFSLSHSSSSALLDNSQLGAIRAVKVSDLINDGLHVYYGPYGP